MKSRVYASLFVFLSLLIHPATASAVSGTANNRYFLETTRSFWRNALGARHVFENGFTADLSELQLRIAKLAGLEPLPVSTFNILADATELPTAPQTTPSQSVSWGVRAMLDDPERTVTRGGTGVSIALIDTGVERTHPDLLRRVTGCFDVTDAAQSFLDGRCDDLNGHGTHMAGILVADGGSQGLGSFGFAPQASLSAYRACNASGFCFSDDIAVAITHATDAGVNIIVLGMGGETQSSLMNDAISYAVSHGVLVVAGAGNDGPYGDSVDWPARDPDVVSVAAIDNAEKPAEFSSHGLNLTSQQYHADEGDVELAAPGVNIESTFPGGGYAILSGTSMAAPHIAGLAALLWQSGSDSPAQATRMLLHEHARDIAEPGDDDATGWGLPDIPDR